MNVMEKVKEYTSEFQETFGVPLEGFTDPILCKLGIYNFDICKFDEFMHRKGYKEESDGSLKSYLTKRYGEKAAILIEKLIDIS